MLPPSLAPQWRCYCKHTLTDDFTKYVLTGPRQAENNNDPKLKDLCTRDEPLKQVLANCRAGHINPDGSKSKDEL